MSRLVIVGAGPFARELYGWVRRSPGFLSGRETIGFLDDDPQSLAGYKSLAGSYLGSIGGYRPRPGDRCLMSIAAPDTKAEVVERLRSVGTEFATFVHESVIMNDDVEIGLGSVICPNAVLSCNATLGEFVSINLSTTIGHDARVGSYCSLMAHVDITGNVQLGERVYVGSNASVLPGIRVGDRAIIGAGSAVIRRVSPGSTVTGVPAQRMFGGSSKAAHAKGEDPSAR
jgi:sugar O-acyltransferase (sialic acid O-acetyltransferase NeuD family)